MDSRSWGRAPRYPDKIVEIDAMADPEPFVRLDPAVLD
jgi:hypothetical protein